MPGPRSAFKTQRKNPNPGGQCVCSPNSRVVDCDGPYVVFTHTEAMNPRAPHIVVGDACMRRGVEKLHPGVFEVPKPVEVEVPAAPIDVEAVVERIRTALAAPAETK